MPRSRLLALAARAFAAVGAAPALALLVLVGGMAAIWWRGRRLWPALGVLYVGLRAVALIWLRDAGAAGRDDVLFLLLVVWATDIGAYLVGRLIGGPRLAPRFRRARPGPARPAACAARCWSAGCGRLAGRCRGLRRGAALAAGLSVVAQAGDLMESAIKRRFGVKDSGHTDPRPWRPAGPARRLLAAAPAAALLALGGADAAVGLWR